MSWYEKEKGIPWFKSQVVVLKTRTLLGNCAKISIPYYYDNEKREWKYTGFPNEPNSIYYNRLEIDEVQTMLIAYVSGGGK